MRVLKLSSILLLSLCVSVNVFAEKTDHDFKKKLQLQTDKPMANSKTKKPASTLTPHSRIKKTSSTFDPTYKTKPQRQSNPTRAANLNNSINSRSRIFSGDNQEFLQTMPSRSAMQMSGSNAKIDGKRGLVSFEKEEESLQAMPCTSALQMSGSNTKIDDKRVLVSVEDVA